MTQKQKQFAQQYILDLDEARAYKAVYASVKTEKAVYTNAQKLLANAEIKNYINQKLNENNSPQIANEAEVMQFLTAVLRGEENNEVQQGEAVCAQTKEKGLVPKDRIKAAELIGRRYGLFTEKMQIKDHKFVQIIDNVPKGDGYD